MLNLQSYWRPTGRNFGGAAKNMGGLCFQVLGSFGVLGVLGVFVFKTPLFSPHLEESTVVCCAVSIKHGLWTTDSDYGLGIKHGLGIKRGLSITDWV